MQKIPLTQGQFALIDDWNYERINDYKWFAHWDKHTKSFYAQTTMYVDGKSKTIGMHRFIMNTPANELCDHKNHNTLDNQEYNLRNVHHSQNTMNSRTRSDNLLGERCICKKGLKFLVQVRKQGYRFYKTFPTLHEAIQVRDNLLLEVHKEFAYTGESQ